MSISPENLTSKGSNAAPIFDVKIGVLAMQGAFQEHINMLTSLRVAAVPVRLPQDLAEVDGLIIPGGESTTIGKLAVQYKLLEPMQAFIDAGNAVWGTCAGLIFLAKDIGATGSGGHVLPPRLPCLDVTVNRNAFGRQVASFEADLWPTFVKETPFRAVFIRAPRIESHGDGVDVLAQLDDGTVVAARQGNLLGTSFHPELTHDARFHQYFLTMVQREKK